MKKASVTVLLISLICSGYCFAEEKEYTVGIEDVFYFPYYAFKNGECTGLSREVLDAFGQKHGYKFTYKPMPVMRLHKNLIKGNTDFIYPDNAEWELNENAKVYYSTPVTEVIDGVMVLPEHKGKGLNRLKKLGTIKDFIMPGYADLIKNNQVRVSESYEFDTLLKLAMQKYIDGAYVTIDCAVYHLQEKLHRPDALVFDPDLPYDITAVSLSSVKHPDIIRDFSTFLNEEKGLTDRLKEKYNIMTPPQK
ncbi:hypothetical protein DENIS_3230 [Desulfonema ishimotonii]|uniref:Uncharacterized protein n=1 Tax=Desulfonema ishimotonii TaxID=45657 RepID=A0A401FZ55_9BACT|nr:transporter substrate-binding domain-containing protein [Desulfonema ishimotonii]GBC62261.1 hypothetical protein DENIS_3230 [Desulfonema ishimotonii]